MFSHVFTKEDKIKNPIKCKGIKTSIISKTIIVDNCKRCLCEVKEE